MKTYLTLIAVAILSQACGAAASKQPNSAATTATTDDSSSTSTQKSASTQTPVVTKASVKVVKTAAVKVVKTAVSNVAANIAANVAANTAANVVIPEAPVDPLTGTTWQTACAVQSNETSYIYQYEFVEGEVTITALIYTDSACQDLSNSSADTMAYAVQGDLLQEGQSMTAGEWDSTGVSSPFTITNNTLITFGITYYQVSEPTE